MDLKSIKIRNENNSAVRALVRGDCTSRRLLNMNRDVFPDGVDITLNEKSPIIFSLDAVKGISSTPASLSLLSDVSSMGNILGKFYLSQCDHSILEKTDCDLIIIDSYADMNFEIWEHKVEKWKCWIHPKHLKEPQKFYDTFVKLGRRTLMQSVEECVELIKILRVKNPNAAVLMLNQQVEYYPKMHERIFFYDMGKLVADRVDNCFFGGVIDKEKLELDDVGSCGPGLTLHYKRQTYRKMLETAVTSGLTLGGDTAIEEKVMEPNSNDDLDKCGPPEEDVEEVAQDDPVFSDDILFRIGSDSCDHRCPQDSYIVDTLHNYIYISGIQNSTRYLPMVINVDDIVDYESWEAGISSRQKKKHDRIRIKQKSEGLGYKTHLLDLRLHSVDRHAIHHSKDSRSGKPMRAPYLKTVEELGGLPKEKYTPIMPTCAYHWSLAYGVFMPKDGHKQGEIEVHEELVGYINVKRIGDIALYSVIMGHGDHLDNGVMYLAHFNFIRLASENLGGWAKGLRHIMYGAVENGGPGLYQWKKMAGFAPCKLYGYLGRTKDNFVN